ncbi:MAG: ABC transporter permease subunit [Desulfobacterales bacterium]|jgi:ABC-type dipeptide/oligopeptide/nickel transport system permease component/CubicO group peptidase (beta-lactamase class C family)|nr:ABC transporter permease subunit [Desulfobacterales bacterium]MCK5486116.1 ABC transporter permease subunit [Desulfobacterales bacterium]
MLELITKRLIAGVVTLFAASVVFFAATEILTGDFATASVGRFARPEVVDMVRESYGLYRPVYVRYLDWLSHLFEGELGRSWASGRKLGTLVPRRLANTLFLAAVTALIAVPLSLALGLVAAAKRGTAVDRLISVTALTTLSVPDYVIGYVVIVLLAVKLPLFPVVTTLIDYQSTWERFYTISLPVLTLGLAMMPNIVRLTRAAVINILTSPFIDMAILKGLPDRRIFIHHALPHAIGPIINAVILGIAGLVVGVVVVEVVFAYPGIGQLMIDAVRLRDMPVIQVCGLIFTATYIVLVLLADTVAIISNPLLTPKQPTTPVHEPSQLARVLRWRRVAVASILACFLIVGYIYVRGYLRGYRLARTDIAATSAAPATAYRDQLTVEELLTGVHQSNRPVHNVYFIPSENSATALHDFSGTLTIAAAKIAGRRVGASAIRDFGSFPALKVDFFTYEGHLVPTARNRILPGKGSWNIVLGPGRVWSEPGDNGYSRASFPFTLVRSQASRTHNGIATFLFDHAHVSALRFQIVQESAPRSKFDGWGQTAMTYTPSRLPNQSAETRHFADELARRTPIQSWAELEQSYDPQKLDRIDATGNRKNITLSGLIIDDVVYARDCRTRWGDYPYCAQMRHGVYSVSKSLGALVAMLRLAQKYGDGVFDLRITDYVDIDSSHAGWRKVTFSDALNMTTGIGDIEPRRVSSYVETDSTALAGKIFGAQTTNEKLKLSAAFGNYPWGPGEVFRYRSSDTFALAVAMDRFIKSKEGPDADLWGLITREVLQPIGINHMPVLHTTEPGGARGIPLLDIGMLPTLDEVAKLVKLLRNGGRHRGEQILSAAKLDEALGNSIPQGLPTGWPIDDGETYYHMSLWLHPFRAQSGRLVRIPAMSGNGGNYVIFMPNGITAFRFADGRYNNPDTWDSSGLRRVADYIRPFK